MKSLRMNQTVAVVMVLAFSSGFSMTAYAEETNDRQTRRENKIAEMKKLKQENPEAFQKAVQEKKAKLKERLQNLKENDPQKYEQVKERIQHNRKEKLEKLREENPEKFKEVMQNRKEKIQDWKQNNPEKYQKFLENHPKAGGADQKVNQGVRDHGQGVGQGNGQGGQRRGAKGARR